MDIQHIDFKLPEKETRIIKVIGVGGGGGNAVNNMYKKGITDVSFALCNTDRMAINNSDISTFVVLGDGLGAGNRPEVARKAALESREDIEKLLSDGTKMVFITATMGGGTGTGAAPVVAQIAHEMGLLTVGIVTIPFDWEGESKILQAMKGVVRMSKYVDAILLINNSKLCTAFPNFDLRKAFATADDVLSQSAKGIAEIITVDGYVNVDFADVCTIMLDGGVAVMNSGTASGERRVTKAIEEALNSPLLNNSDLSKASRMLLYIYTSDEQPISMAEIKEVKAFTKRMLRGVEVIWGATFSKEMQDEVKVTVIATGPQMKFVSDDLLRLINNEILVEEKEENPDKDSADGTVEITVRDPSINDRIMEELYGEVVEEPEPLKVELLRLEELDDEAIVNRLLEEPAIDRQR